MLEKIKKFNADANFLPLKVLGAAIGALIGGVIVSVVNYISSEEDLGADYQAFEETHPEETSG